MLCNRIRAIQMMNCNQDPWGELQHEDGESPAMTVAIETLAEAIIGHNPYFFMFHPQLDGSDEVITTLKKLGYRVCHAGSGFGNAVLWDNHDPFYSDNV